MRMLVTGFPPFPGQPINPSQQLVERIHLDGFPLPGIVAVAELLPVEYRRVESEVRRCLKIHQPDVWLAFGVCRRNEMFHLEAIGRNWDQTDRPDNAGEVRNGVEIVEGGPAEIRTACNLHELQQLLLDSGMEAVISEDAGSYLCNHLLYYVQYELARTANRSQFLFTHVAPPEAGFPPEKLWQGLLAMATWARNCQTATSGDASGPA